MFALWGLFTFCILWYCFCTERLSCTCCHGNPARVNNRTCCMMGECNCARMPVQNPFGRVGLFLSAFPVFCPILSFSFFGFSTSVSLIQPFFCLSFVSFIFLCCDYGVVFACFAFVSVLFLNLLFRYKCLSFCGSFVCEICVSFQNDAALLLESRSANANAE